MRVVVFVAVSILAAGTSCTTINGKAYPPGTRFALELSCQMQSGGLQVIVNDWMGTPPPGARVAMTSEPAGSADSAISDRRGASIFPCAPGRWLVSVRLPGFNSASRTVELEVGQACVVRFYLRLSDRYDPEIVSQLGVGPLPQGLLGGHS